MKIAISFELSSQGVKSVTLAPAVALKLSFSGATSPEIRKKAERWLEDYLAGKAKCALPPLDLSPISPFRDIVLKALLEIPFGETRTYGEMADIVGSPRAARAVGSACGANPLPLLIPCHRVVAAGGGLGGFGGGLSIKQELLDHERRAI